MDPNQTPPQVGVNSGSTGASATGKSIFANPQNRFKDTNPNGDIIIPPSGGSGSGSGGSGPKKPLSKKLVIGIVVAAILAVAVVVLVIINLNKGSSTRTSTSSGDDSSIMVADGLEESFNMYANFITLGEPLKTRLPSEEGLEKIKINTAIISGDTEFIKTAQEYYDQFYSIYEENENGSAELSEIVESYRELVDSLDQYVEIKPLTMEEIDKIVATASGSLSAESRIDEYYASAESTENSGVITRYVSALINYDKAVANKSDSTTIVGLLSEISNIQNNIINDTMKDCYVINDLLYHSGSSPKEGE